MKSTALPKSFEDWLSRPSHIGPRPRKPLKKTSGKRAKQLREYSKRRKAFLEKHRFCAGKKYVGVCSENLVGQAIHTCFKRPTDIHHKAGRVGEKLLDESDWLPLCRTCHEYIHSHPKEARALGLLA